MSADDFNIEKPHRNFQSYINQKIIDRGYLIINTGYHDFFPQWLVDLMHLSNDVKDLYYRLLPDILVVNPREKDTRFFIDYKTSQNSHAYIEAFQWAANIEREKIRTIYLYYNELGKYTKAWLADDPQVIGSIHHIIYRKCKLLPPEAIEIIKKYLIDTPHNKRKVEFPRNPTNLMPPYGVSGDCTTVINPDEIKYFKDIKPVLDLYLPDLNV